MRARTDRQTDWRDGWERRASPEQGGDRQAGGAGGRSDGKGSAPERRLARRPGHCSGAWGGARAAARAALRPRSLCLSTGRRAAGEGSSGVLGHPSSLFISAGGTGAGLRAGLAPTPPQPLPFLAERDSQPRPSLKEHFLTLCFGFYIEFSKLLPPTPPVIFPLVIMNKEELCSLS